MAIPTGFAALRGSLNTRLRKDNSVTAAGQQAGPSTDEPAEGREESHQMTNLSSEAETSFPHRSDSTIYSHHGW